jgi:hypothetical protein
MRLTLSNFRTGPVTCPPGRESCFGRDGDDGDGDFCCADVSELAEGVGDDHGLGGWVRGWEAQVE